MNEPTVTVPTLDHGLVQLTEPAWCLGHDQEPALRGDILHTGPEHTAVFRGRQLAVAALAQSPFAPVPTVAVSVQCGGFTQALEPAGLDELAAVLVDYAATLRHLARQLATITAGEGE
ncbi:DUF6907 domain-containing protein [Streptomyces sp. NPDC002835]